MKVEVKKIDATRRELKLEISKERVKSKLEEVYKDIGKVANVKGFRKGKVPRNVLESNYSATANEEVLKQLIPEVYQEALGAENLSPIDMPDIEDVSFKDGQISFKASLDIKPEVKIKDYKGIKVTRKSSQVTDEEINKTLEYFKQGQGQDKEIVINDDFAHGLGYPSLEEFKKTLSRQMEIDKDRQNKADVENQIVEALLKKTKFVVPKALKGKQIKHRIEHEKEHMEKQKLPQEEIAKREEKLTKELPPIVEKEIKIYLILEKIAQLENIESKEGQNLPMKVIEFLLKEAAWS